MIDQTVFRFSLLVNNEGQDEKVQENSIYLDIMIDPLP